MEKISLSILKIIIFVSLLMLGITTFVLTYLHIIYLPRTFFLYREVVIIVSAFVLFILSLTQKLKGCKKLALIILLMGIFNIVGFNLIVKMI